ncbi:hypothetical protein MA16_Dca028343 [Dendrobium catenatum]|uniref:Uncharacterized protein n=1 Tax=Dendrobium catenatum TaxID=906689 RepID=A0A2I0VBK4_9ASPA|nr:hypothetical protein MA16_Dca028343 [Dendrobium catenatum]
MRSIPQENHYKSTSFLMQSILHSSLTPSALGRSKVFLRAGQIAVLDARRNEVLDNSARFVQGRFRTFIARKEFVNTKNAAVALQAYCRGMPNFFGSCYDC